MQLWLLVADSVSSVRFSRSTIPAQDPGSDENMLKGLSHFPLCHHNIYFQVQQMLGRVQLHGVVSLYTSRKARAPLKFGSSSLKVRE